MMSATEDPLITAEQTHAIEEAIKEVEATKPWKRWLKEPGVKDLCLVWLITDHEQSQVTRTPDGAEYHLSATEISQAAAAGRLKQWTQRQLLVHADFASWKHDLTGIEGWRYQHNPNLLPSLDR